MKIEVIDRILAANEATAAQVAELFRRSETLALNLLGSPGSGKTELLEHTIRALGNRLRCAVIEGDVATTTDAERLCVLGVPVVQIETANLPGVCHLNATMTREAVERLDLNAIDLLFIENVGNLVCPAAFELGEYAKVAVVSVTEGEDKPLKYPGTFRNSEAVVISKTDLLPHLDVDMVKLRDNVRATNAALEILELSARTGTGCEAWQEWLLATREQWLARLSV